MRVLLDENVDHRLRRFFDSEHEVTFDALITTDRNVPYQQNVARLRLSVIILEAKSNTLENLTPLMVKFNAAMKQVRPGAIQRISA